MICQIASNNIFQTFLFVPFSTSLDQICFRSRLWKREKDLTIRRIISNKFSKTCSFFPERVYLKIQVSTVSWLFVFSPSIFKTRLDLYLGKERARDQMGPNQLLDCNTICIQQYFDNFTCRFCSSILLSSWHMSELDFSANSAAHTKDIMYNIFIVSKYNAVIRKLSEKLLWNKGTFHPCQACPRTHLLSRKFHPHFKCCSLFSGEHGNFVGEKSW